MSGRLRNYTCADETLETSKPVRKVEIGTNGSRYLLNVLLEKKNSKIWFIDDFITQSIIIITIIVKYNNNNNYYYYN